MFKFFKKTNQDKLNQEDFTEILKEIKRLNNEKTPHRNMWKLRQTWINNYIDLTLESIK